MINFTDIEQHLQDLDAKYNLSMSTASTQDLLWISKLSVIVFSGWIEETLDDILYDYLNSKIVDSHFNNEMRKIVSHNYGFAFKSNFCKLFCNILGATSMETVMFFLSSDASVLESIFDDYTQKRNDAAHTMTIGRMPTYPSPSAILSDLRRLKPALQHLESEIKSL